MRESKKPILEYCTIGIWVCLCISVLTIVLHVSGTHVDEPFPRIVLLPYLVLPTYLIVGFRQLRGANGVVSTAFFLAVNVYYAALAAIFVVATENSRLSTFFPDTLFIASQFLTIAYFVICATFAFVIRANDKSIWSFVIWFLISINWFVAFSLLKRRLQAKLE